MESLTTRIFDAMLEDIIMDIVLKSHQELLRSTAICKTCNTTCGSAHLPESPGPGSPPTTNAFETGTSTPTKIEGGNIYFACPSCEREISSNRLAPHLSSCMGLGNGTRRQTTRGTNKPKNPPDLGRSATPESDTTNPPKSKGKRTDDVEFNSKRKRQLMSQTSPNKKSKKPTAVPRSRGEHDSFSPPKVPSRLRADSTASFVEDRSSPPESRHSSPEGGSEYSPTQIPHSLPVSRTSSIKNNKPNPPASKQPVVPRPSVYSGYSFDAEGDETGSSTDTDAS